MIRSFAENFKEELHSVNDQNFESATLALFDYQYHECDIYGTYCQFLNKNPSNVKKLGDIPFLPIEFFKFHDIKSGRWTESKVFKSSGTSGTVRSRHYVKEEKFYLNNTKVIFEKLVGSIDNYRYLSVLPSYLEQGDSSLIAMVNSFINQGLDKSGFYAMDEVNLSFVNDKTILFGVTYALLDLAMHLQSDRPFTIIETGGMKGRRKEIVREEFHQMLLESFPNAKILSEYGMTEMLSQGYGSLSGLNFPQWCKPLIRDINDPFHYLQIGQTGGINMVDLANTDTCSFLETKDLGKINQSGKLEVLGRFDNSDIRGCNLLI